MNRHRPNYPGRVALFAGIALLSVGCATREVPRRFPAGSPLSATKAVAPEDNVTNALTGDPPLPGEDLQSWPGLAPAPMDGPAGAKAAPSCGSHDHGRSAAGGHHDH